MSKIKFLAPKSFAPWITKVVEMQLQQCDKDGGVVSKRNVCDSRVVDPCYHKADDDEKMDLTCKVALVTGGASGIGFAIANQLLFEGLHRVVLGDLDPCKGLRAAARLADTHGENKACFIPLNVACIKQLEEVMTQVKSNFENLDILVNNAAVVTDDIDLELDTNVRPILHSGRIATKLMKTQRNKGGVIINIGDTKGLTACKYFPEYASEKSGVHKYSMGSGATSKSNNIRIVAVAPGLTNTEMGEKFVNKPDSVCLQQKASIVGKAVAYTARYAESGTLWVIENRRLSRANWPSKSSYLELITTL